MANRFADACRFKLLLRASSCPAQSGAVDLLRRGQLAIFACAASLRRYTVAAFRPGVLDQSLVSGGTGMKALP